MHPFLLFGLLALLATVIGFVLSRYYEKKRTRALKSIANSLNLSFSEMSNRGLLESLSRFQLFSQGGSRRISNVMRGTAYHADYRIMDYQYTISAGKHSRTRRQTVMLFSSDRLYLPEFALRPEKLFHKIGGVFGYQDIDFPTHPEFSAQYLLRGSAEERVRDVFNEAVLAYYDRHKGLCTEGAGDKLIFYRASKKISPNNIPSFLQEGLTIFNLFKR